MMGFSWLIVWGKTKLKDLKMGKTLQNNMCSFLSLQLYQV